MRQLSERDKVTLVVAYVVGGGLSGLSFGVAILSHALPWPTWVGACSLAGGMCCIYLLAKIARVARKRVR